MSISIRTANDAADFEAFADLIGEYVEWSRERYREDPWFVEHVFGYQSLADELQSLQATYSAPNGKALVAISDGAIAGAVAYRVLDDGSCEMKRLFVSGKYKGLGAGRLLCRAIVDAARDDGFALVRLDTGHRLTEAIAMYRSMGFQECAPHRVYPPDLMPHLVFMELPLAPRARGLIDERT